MSGLLLLSLGSTGALGAATAHANGDLIWARQLGGTSDDLGTGVAVDAAGNMYTTGSFSGTADFDPGAGSLNMTSLGNADVFVSKLDPDGDLVWVRQLGGASDDLGTGVAVDAAGNVYTTGYFSETADFDPDPGTLNLTSTGSLDVFVWKLDADRDLVWARQLGGPSPDFGNAVAVDAAGNVYTTGHFGLTADFDPGPGSLNLTSAGGYDVFVWKLDVDGDLVWARQLGSALSDFGYGVAVDANDNVYTTGYFVGTADFDPGPGSLNLTSAGGTDAFVSKLDVDGDLVWARQLGGAGDDLADAVTVDAAANVHTTGQFSETADFDPGLGNLNLTAVAFTDAFVSKLDTDGNLVWARQLGGTGSDLGRGIALDAASNVYTTGYFSETADFDPGPSTLNLTSAGSRAVYVSKLDADGDLVWARELGSTGLNEGYGVAVDAGGKAYITGFFFGTADFNPGPATSDLTSAGSSDVFVWKLDGLEYVSQSPGRLLDTRAPGGTTVDGLSQAIGTRAAGSITELQITGRADVPANASAAVLNVTVTGATGTGYITVYPCGSPQPNASNINYTAGGTIANLTITKIGTGGKICIYTSEDTQLIADLNGYYPN